MSGFGAGIRRGVMAADQFTQIANDLFRDPKISFKAKGIFGYISTHRNEWRVTTAALVALGPDGRDAVRTALNELEQFGYLVRERVRRPNGTLGQIVYSITDRPAAPDALPIDSASAFREPGNGADFGAGIRRGVMAADQFTQIANALFRDSRISFKAKGLFGYISTHRDGWQITVATLARHGRERVDAVTTGLEELENHGFLLRERERNRNADGTLGQALYCITDLPALQSPSSQPESGYPGLAQPVLANPGTTNTIVKKTNNQNTNNQNTNPLRPCDHSDAARTNVRPPRTRQHRRLRPTRCTPVSGCCWRSGRAVPSCC
ncbi:helix-turn-helix domain-containing protein [Streptomyces phaeoluteigriseus]|uniref:helix-turn-helix domain-containing protein n=1 Tax=Streptomyces phaeoluteigriseus TaxID=114686 RepID=UPI000ACC927B|nr:helix-turn-helix domain-containing protein [Streptomyces phaeoluteigriseus]